MLKPGLYLHFRCKRTRTTSYRRSTVRNRRALPGPRDSFHVTRFSCEPCSVPDQTASSNAPEEAKSDPESAGEISGFPYIS